MAWEINTISAIAVQLEWALIMTLSRTSPKGGGGCVLKNANVSNFVSSPSFFLWNQLHMI